MSKKQEPEASKQQKNPCIQRFYKKLNRQPSVSKLSREDSSFHKCSEIIVRYHRKKHLKIRNKIKFHPTLPTIEEVDETDQTPCNSPYLPPFNQPPDNISSPAPTINNLAIPTPRAIHNPSR
ncbi:hypothetical protein TNCV_504111 [Trichonephila clavipes]|nr:hypothetical protein TNCV_504111 [Trichonephila clavipes]